MKILRYRLMKSTNNFRRIQNIQDMNILSALRTVIFTEMDIPSPLPRGSAGYIHSLANYGCGNLDLSVKSATSLWYMMGMYMEPVSHLEYLSVSQTKQIIPFMIFRSPCRETFFPLPMHIGHKTVHWIIR